MTAPELDQLRQALDAMAAEVKQVDLRDRVHATSRRLARRRSLTGACAAVLVGATALTTGWAVVPAWRDGTLTGTVTGSTSCAAAEPSGPWLDPDGWSTLTPQPTIDELFYLEKEPAPGASVVRLVSWRPGMPRPIPRCELPREAVHNASASPDGRWLTWVSAPDGALHIADLTGERNDRILRKGVDADTLAPAWSPDGRRLVVRDVSGGADAAVVGTIDIGTGRFTRLRTNLPDARHLVWSADGAAIAFVTARGAAVVAEPDGSGQRRVPNLDGVVSVQSLSAPASTGSGQTRWLTVRVADGQEREAPYRSLVSNAMVTIHDGDEIGVVGTIGEHADFQAFFRDEPGQGGFSHLLRRVGDKRMVELIGGNGEYWGGGDEPAELAGFILLGA